MICTFSIDTMGGPWLPELTFERSPGGGWSWNGVWLCFMAIVANDAHFERRRTDPRVWESVDLVGEPCRFIRLTGAQTPNAVLVDAERVVSVSVSGNGEETWVNVSIGHSHVVYAVRESPEEVADLIGMAKLGVIGGPSVVERAQAVHLN